MQPTIFETLGPALHQYLRSANGSYVGCRLIANGGMLECMLLEQQQQIGNDPLLRKLAVLTICGGLAYFMCIHDNLPQIYRRIKSSGDIWLPETRRLTASAGDQSHAPSNDTITQAIKKCLSKVDPDTATREQVKALVEQKLQCQLGLWQRLFLDAQIFCVLAESNSRSPARRAIDYLDRFATARLAEGSANNFEQPPKPGFCSRTIASLIFVFLVWRWTTRVFDPENPVWIAIRLSVLSLFDSLSIVTTLIFGGFQAIWPFLKAVLFILVGIICGELASIKKASTSEPQKSIDRKMLPVRHRPSKRPEGTRPKELYSAPTAKRIEALAEVRMADNERRTCEAVRGTAPEQSSEIKCGCGKIEASVAKEQDSPISAAGVRAAVIKDGEASSPLDFDVEVYEMVELFDL